MKRSHLYQEIYQQPEVFTQLLTQEQENIQQLVTAIKQRNLRYVIIAARGTSDNAGRYAQYLLGAVNNLTVALATPSLFTVYKQPPRLGKALALGISQSGKSPDIVAVLAEARRQGVLTLAITNIVDSDLGKEADYVINLHAGVENAVAATKTYTSQLGAIALFSASLAENAPMISELKQIPETIAMTLTMDAEIARLAARYRDMRDCVVIGRGYNYATAFELALKLKELTRTVAEPYSSADFLHGPVTLIERGYPVIVIAPSGVMLPKIQKFVHTLKQREAEVIIISDDSETLAMAHVPVALPRAVPEWLSPITVIILGQLLAMHLAHIRNYDLDHPNGLSKVTETE